MALSRYSSLSRATGKSSVINRIPIDFFRLEPGGWDRKSQVVTQVPEWGSLGAGDTCDFRGDLEGQEIGGKGSTEMHHLPRWFMVSSLFLFSCV